MQERQSLNPSASHVLKNRIAYLDGHRGVAILLVVLFHAYARWPELVPYHNVYATIPLFRFGWIGVELFFLVSGFVILMTLERCTTAGEFLKRRWLRLLPAMFVCSLLIFFTSGVFQERPDGAPSPASLIPGLTFIEPSWWQNLLGVPVRPLEGGYWSLYVEMKFYIFAALVYFWRGRNALIVALSGAFLFGTFCKVADASIGGTLIAEFNNVSRNLSFEYFGWFAAGAAFYVYAIDRNVRWLLMAIALALASSAFVRIFDWRSVAVAALVSLFFATSIISPLIQRALESRVFQFFGSISYPLYLLQENLMIATVIKFGALRPDMPLWCYPLVPIAALSVLAYGVARYVEPNFKTLLAPLAFKKPSQRAA